MSTISEHVSETTGDLVDPAPQESLEVHRDGPLSLVVGGTAGVLAVAFLLRGVGSGAPLDWALFALTGLLAGLHLAAVVDARAPLFVLDQLGVRVRRGATWQGVEWAEVDHVEHVARATTLRDGSLTVVTVDGRRLGVRLSLSTGLVGADWHEVDEALVDLSGGAVPVVGRAPEPDADDEPSAPAYDEQTSLVTDPDTEPALVVDDVVVEQPEPVEAEVEPVTEQATEPVVEALRDVEPTRAFRPALRSEVVLDRPARADSLDPDGEESELPIAAQTETIIIDGFAAETADRHEPAPAPVDPVIGRQLAAARGRVGISVDALAERTRIRPHVIEAIERDDFEACGGDFYARGHLRTLARVLGVDAAALLELFDERYSHAPIDARRVFEAELASGPVGTSGSRGLNWSVLVAAVMAVVLVWSVARLVMDGPVPLADQPVLNGSPGGGKAALSNATTEVPVVLTAATGGSRVTVRDARQQVVFTAQLAFMQTAELEVAPPVRISSSDGGLQVTVDGVEEGAIGATGQDAQRTYVP